MMPITHMSANDWIALGPRLVGVVFLWAAAIKAISPRTFQRHLSALGWLPWALVGPAVTAAAASEAALGAALLVGLAPAILLPSTLLILILLTAVAWWGVHTGSTTDCGCYGGYIEPSIGQSIGLNSLFALVVGAAWYVQRGAYSAALWQVVVVAAIAVVAGSVAYAAQRFAMKNGEPLFDLSPLKVGKKWKHSLANNATVGIEGEMLVSFLGPDCPFCVLWVKALNAMQQSPSMPAVLGIVGASNERLGTFVEQNGIRFPVTTISSTLMNRLVQGVPTTALIKSGAIDEIWVGSMPPEFFYHRFRKAFFPDPDPEKESVDPVATAATRT